MVPRAATVPLVNPGRGSSLDEVRIPEAPGRRGANSCLIHASIAVTKWQDADWRGVRFRKSQQKRASDLDSIDGWIPRLTSRVHLPLPIWTADSVGVDFVDMPYHTSKRPRSRRLKHGRWSDRPLQCFAAQKAALSDAPVCRGVRRCGPVPASSRGIWLEYASGCDANGKYRQGHSRSRCSVEAQRDFVDMMPARFP
jgi:hypothetical protein